MDVGSPLNKANLSLFYTADVVIMKAIYFSKKKVF